MVAGRIFGRSVAHSLAMKPEASAGATDHESFGLLPWITILLTALAVAIACLLATR